MRLGKTHILIGLVAAIAIYLVVNGIYNYLLSEEQKIKNVLESMKSDIEDGDVLGFSDYFTRDADIRYLEFDVSPNQVGLFIARLTKNYKKLEIKFTELSVEIKGEQAVVTFAGEAAEAGRRTGGLFEGTAKLRKVEGEWKIFDATGRERRRPRMVF